MTSSDDAVFFAATHADGRSVMAPIAIFGRGRVLCFLMMALLALFSYVSNHTGWHGPAASPYRFSGDAAAGVPQSTIQLVVSHGGVLDDDRAELVRMIGRELASRVAHLPPDTFRFYVLNDAERKATYVLPDGSILVTAAQIDACSSQELLAETLSQRIAEYVFQGYDRSQYPQVDAYSGQLLAAAGYGPLTGREGSGRARLARDVRDEVQR